MVLDHLVHMAHYMFSKEWAVHFLEILASTKYGPGPYGPGQYDPEPLKFSK